MFYIYIIQMYISRVRVRLGYSLIIDYGNYPNFRSVSIGSDEITIPTYDVKLSAKLYLHLVFLDHK
jgi:hypothetical protein